jgi:hypothetical protein
MKVIHFCLNSENNTDIINRYLPVLQSRLENTVEMIITTKENDFRKQAVVFHPDMIHIHDCWSRVSAQIAKWAKENHVPYVLSPHGKLDPWIVEENYIHEKLPKLLLYQHEMICNADAIIVSGELEKQNISLLSWNEHFANKSHWNNRIEKISNCIISNDISEEDMANEMAVLYRKVIDSNAWILMNEELREVENTLLKSGIAHNDNDYNLSKEQIDKVLTIDNESWRRLMIHSTDEGVLNIIENGAKRLNANMPDIDINKINRYPLQTPKSTEKLENKNLISDIHKSKFRNLKEDYGECLELDICRMIANIQ